jgi:hypothetical protein
MGMIDIETATHKELLKEYDHQMNDVWGKYSCDCLGFYIRQLHKAITEKGGWPMK